MVLPFLKNLKWLKKSFLIEPKFIFPPDLLLNPSSLILSAQPDNCQLITLLDVASQTTDNCQLSTDSIAHQFLHNLSQSRFRQKIILQGLVHGDCCIQACTAHHGGI